MRKEFNLLNIICRICHSIEKRTIKKQISRRLIKFILINSGITGFEGVGDIIGICDLFYFLRQIHILPFSLILCAASMNVTYTCPKFAIVIDGS